MNRIGIGRNLVTLATTAVFCCATAFAQHGSSMPQQQEMPQDSPNTVQNQGLNNPNALNSQASPNDIFFVKKALQGSVTEVQMGQLALQKSTNDQVKQFAQRMVTDHSKMIDHMKPIAQQLGVKVPNGPDKKEKAEMAKLGALSGPDFDQEYVKAMVKDHKEDDSDFRTEINSGQSPVIKNAASQGDSVILSHLQQIEGIAKSMNVTGM